MIKAAGKYSTVATARRAPASASQPSTLNSQPSLNILVKRLARIQTLRDWWFKEIKDGGFLHGYVRREKYQMTDRFRAVARKFVNWKQPTKTDFRLRAAIPARLYHRLKQEDPHFFECNKNLKRLKADNPEATIPS